MPRLRERARRLTLAGGCFALAAFAAFALAATPPGPEIIPTPPFPLTRGLPPDALTPFRLATTTTVLWITPIPTDPDPRPVVAGETLTHEPAPEKTAPVETKATATTSTTTTTTSATTTTTGGFDFAGAERSFANRINSVRESEGLPALAWDGGAASVGRSWSQMMVEGVGCSHNASLASQISGSWTKLAENLACNAPSVASAHAALVASSSHYSNMVDPDFTHVGIGVAIDAEGGIWVTQVFISR